MEGLQRVKLGARFERMRPFIGEKVNMALAEGVVHFSHHGDERAISPVTKPEAHWLERVAAYPREGVKPDLAIGAQPRTVEQAGNPGARRASIAVIGGMK